MVLSSSKWLKKNCFKCNLTLLSFSVLWGTGLFKKGIEFNKVAQALNASYILINELEYKRNNDLMDGSSEESFTLIAFVVRRDILNRINEYNWDMMTSIIVPAMSNRRITLMLAYTQVVDRLITMCEDTFFEDKIKAILDIDKDAEFKKAQAEIGHLVRGI